MLINFKLLVLLFDKTSVIPAKLKTIVTMRGWNPEKWLFITMCYLSIGEWRPTPPYFWLNPKVCKSSSTEEFFNAQNTCNN